MIFCFNFVDAKPGKIHRARRRLSEIKTDSVRIFHWVKQDDDWLIEDAISLCRWGEIAQDFDLEVKKYQSFSLTTGAK